MVYLLDNLPRGLKLAESHSLFKQKCDVKELARPTVQSLSQLVNDEAELRSEWGNMLAHQLPNLPDLDSVLLRLPGLLAWIEQPTVVLPSATLAATPMRSDEQTVTSPSIRYWGGGVSLETIRFAGANRLLVEFDYHGKHRVVEPYSLRRAGTGNLLFYGWEVSSQHFKAFKVAEMLGIKSTQTSFTPRYQIELASIAEPVAVRAAGQTRPLSTPLYPRAHKSSPLKTGPSYVFRCSHCGREFRHRKNNPKLRKHKVQSGDWDCSGRHGYLERVDY